MNEETLVIGWLVGWLSSWGSGWGKAWAGLQLLVGLNDVLLYYQLLPSASNVANKELSAHVVVVAPLRVLAIVVSHEAVHDGFHHAWWVGRGRRNVLVEVHGFLVGLGGNAIGFDGDCQVEEVD